MLVNKEKKNCCQELKPQGGADLFSLGSRDKTPGSQGRLALHRRKHFFTERVFRGWHRLPREVIDAPSLSVLKRHLDNALTFGQP